MPKNDPCFPDIQQVFKRKKTQSDEQLIIYDDDEDDPKTKIQRKVNLKSPFAPNKKLCCPTREWNSRFSEFSDLLKEKKEPLSKKKEQTSISEIVWEHTASSEHIENEESSQSSDISIVISQTCRTTPTKFQIFEESSIIPETPLSTPQKLSDSEDSSLIICETPEFKLKQASESPCKNSSLSELSKDGSSGTKISPTESPDPKMSARGTNWLQTLSKSIKKLERVDANDLNFLDSQKLKKKPKSGGFAEQLRKVISRETSSLNMWKHQTWQERKKKRTGEDRKSLTVRVNQMTFDSGLYHAECSIIKTMLNSGSPISYFNSCIVLLNQDTNLDNSITIGTILRIHPPWQELRNSSGIPMLISVYHTLVIDRTELEQQAPREDILFAWSCQCRELNLNPKSCSSHTEANMLSSSSPNSDQVEGNSSEDKESPAIRTVKIRTPTQNSPIGGESQHKQYSILKAVEDSGGSTDRSYSRVSLEARLEEVWSVSSPLSRSKVRWQALIKDREDVYCRLDLPPISEPSNLQDAWANLTRSSTGEWYRFTGLSVSARLNAESGQPLFENIKKLAKDFEREVQPFCYVFQSYRGDSKCVNVAV